MASFTSSSVGPSMVFGARHVSQFPNYVQSDSGRGRCRIHPSSPITHLSNVKIGRILRLRVYLSHQEGKISGNQKEGESLDVYCTLWPDSENILQLNEISIDDTVLVGERTPWTHASCKIDTIYIAKAASSIKFSSIFHGKSSHDLKFAVMNRLPLHLPVIANSSIFLPAHVSPTGTAVTTTVQSVHPATASTPMLTNHMTIFIPTATCNNDARSSNETKTGNSSMPSSVARTQVVQQIMSKMVHPLRHSETQVDVKNIPHYALYRGIMLLGPPGVGKTFAVQAVQNLCRQQFGSEFVVEIIPVSIPELLSSEDPITTLQSILPTIPKPKTTKPQPQVQSSAASPMKSTVTTPVGPSKSGCTAKSTASSASTPMSTPVANSNNLHAVSSPQKGFSFSASALKQPPSTSSFSFKNSLSPSQTTASGSILSPIKSPLGGSSTLSTAAASSARNKNTPMRLVFFVVDEIDALGHRHRQNDVQIALKLLLCDWLDQLQNMNPLSHMANNKDGTLMHYAMVATSNRSEDVDICFRRGGRLEQEMIVVLTKEDRKLLWRSYLTAFVYKLSSSLAAINNDNDESSSHISSLRNFVQKLISSFESISNKKDSANRSLSLDHILHESSVGTKEQDAWATMLEVLGETSGGYVAADITAIVSELERQLFPSNNMATAELSLSAQCALIQQLATLIDKNSSLVAHQTQILSSGSAMLLSLVYSVMKKIPPSCLRGVSLTAPNLSLMDVIGHHDAKVALQRVLQFTNPKMQPILKRFGLQEGLGGVLLYGPPGNSKTRLVAATAASYHLPLLSLSSADVYSAYVGDAEAEVRRAFALARQAAPCILFFDELDSLVLNRAHHSGAGASSSSVEARVLSTFLNEMDGVTSTAQAAAAGILVMAATNRIDCIDAALLRKGRFYQSIYVAPPSAEDRRALMQYFGRKAHLSEAEIEKLLAEKTWEGMSGADVENVCKEAAVSVFQVAMMSRHGENKEIA